MSDPKSRTIPDAFTMYFVMLLIYCIDIFFFKSDLTVLGDAFYSRFLSMLVLAVYLWSRKKSFDNLGISKKKEKFVTGVVYGSIFSVIPIILVMAAECIIYGLTDVTAIDLRFSPPSLSHVYDIAHLTPAAAIIIYVLTSFFGSMFKEFFFRGYMLKKLKSATKFPIANLVQALLYMSFTLPMLLRNLVNHYYDNTTASLGLFIVIFYIVHETLAGYKWGLLTRVTGCTYVAVVDHFLYVFLSNSVYITNRYVTWSFMLHMLAIQLVSTAMVVLYYKVNMKKLEEKREKEKNEKESKHRSHSEQSKEHEKSRKIDESIEKIDAISPSQYKDIVNKASDENHRHHHHSSDGTHRHGGRHRRATLESLPTSEANKIANDFLEETLNSSHHGHHVADNGDKIEDFAPGEASEKTDEYSDSLPLEKKSHKHHRSHSQNEHSTAENENVQKKQESSEEDIDAFLRNYSSRMSSHHHYHHHSSYPDMNSDESMEIGENFDADSFLESFQSHHEHHSSHSSHHHGTDSFSDDDGNENFSSAIQEFKETKEESEVFSGKEKQGFFNKVKNLGLIDDSESNDLL